MKCNYLKLRILLFFLIAKNHSAFSQTLFYQDIIKGGIISIGYEHGWPAFNKAEIPINIPMQSTIKKSFLFYYMRFKPKNEILIINNNSILLDTNSIITNSINFKNINNGDYFFFIGQKDITSLISSSEDSIRIIPPNQNNLDNSPLYMGYTIVIIYSNPNFSNISFSTIINNQNSKPLNTYSISSNNVSLNYPVGFSLNTSNICDTIQDGSYIKVNADTIGLIGGADEIGNFFCGTLGYLQYHNDSLFGISDDTPDTVMRGSDALADIKPYLDAQSPEQITVEVSYQQETASAIPYYAPYTNAIWNLLFAHTTPCDTFTATLSADTVICAGSSLNLLATGGNTYEWLPQKDLSCYNCPNPSFVGDSSRVYTVRITNTPGCSKVYPVRVRVLPNPMLDSVLVSSAICGNNDGAVHFIAKSDNSTTLNYSLNTQNQAVSVFENLSPGNYNYSITDSLGCQVSGSLALLEENKTKANFSLSPAKGNVPLTIEVKNQSLNANSFIYRILNDTFYTPNFDYLLTEKGVFPISLLAYNNKLECSDTISATVIAENESTLIMPSIINLSKDKNLYFSAFNCQKLEIVFYNLNGKKVWQEQGFCSDSQQKMYLGNLASGMYLYQISATYGQEIKQYSGKLVVVN